MWQNVLVKLGLAKTLLCSVAVLGFVADGDLCLCLSGAAVGCESHGCCEKAAADAAEVDASAPHVCGCAQATEQIVATAKVVLPSAGYTADVAAASQGVASKQAAPLTHSFLSIPSSVLRI
jgi:hypothetical protein